MPSKWILRRRLPRSLPGRRESTTTTTTSCPTWIRTIRITIGMIPCSEPSPIFRPTSRMTARRTRSRRPAWRNSAASSCTRSTIAEVPRTSVTCSGTFTRRCPRSTRTSTSSCRSSGSDSTIRGFR
uniref:(northern house mosquito) hypothetical protein n=1 Tax=Culex pipiens TaxID=7175 RepID=A0A8D8HME6_CULPI